MGDDVKKIKEILEAIYPEGILRTIIDIQNRYKQAELYVEYCRKKP